MGGGEINQLKPSSLLTSSILLLLYFSNILLRLVECPGQAMAPYFPVTVKSTREVAGFNALAEALLRLDFIHAVSDVRRYVHFLGGLFWEDFFGEDFLGGFVYIVPGMWPDSTRWPRPF